MNLLGIDFEDWYHPELIQRNLGNEEKEPTVINGIDKILNWLNKNETLATFFVVGELLEFKPELIDKILSNGHEIGFHTMYHNNLVDKGYKEKFDEELKIFKKITNGKSKGFRSPTFSLNESTSWAIDSLEKNDYIYDSSIMPAKTNMYGMPNASKKPYRISSDSLEKDNPNGKLIEFPLLTTKFLGKRIPAAGGFYLRILPQKIIENAIKTYEKDNIPATFYIHSWELAPEFMKKIPLSTKDNFITYHNLEKAFSRMDKIIKKFQFTSFEKYIGKNK
ncbi:polysaccharide deacetylase family protein [Nitrosopumilus sp.]|uniref:polysaccharide deacetylase family protein n=1 Tax=Nitrosopumilus sp. TaxID=2024843 RepID=UPI00349FF694